MATATTATTHLLMLYTWPVAKGSSLAPPSPPPAPCLVSAGMYLGCGGGSGYGGGDKGDGGGDDRGDGGGRVRWV